MDVGRFKISYWKLGFLILIVVLIGPDIAAPDLSFFLYGVNLLIHEAGHPLFGIFGSEFLMMAGGTLMQLIIPAVFVGYFFIRRDLYAAGIVMFWLADSLASVVPYMADAVLMQVPLIGGEAVKHDWNYMFGRLGLLDSTAFLAGTTHVVAIIFGVAALGVSLWWCRKSEVYLK